MLYLYLLSWVATFVQVCFSILAVAAGLYYLAELVEEFTVTTGKIIRILILVTLAIYIGLFVFEDLPTTMIGCGMLSQVMHMLVLRTFPFFNLYSVPFLSASALVILNHYLAFNYFSNKAYTLSEMTMMSSQTTSLSETSATTCSHSSTRPKSPSCLSVSRKCFEHPGNEAECSSPVSSLQTCRVIFM
ncbi:protein TEX261 isoform X2 [Dermacentor variabilis]|uniref:protein TEX261 isoform X2 n=1 Tax=Dermacentor variabilis TaxID=34621 RepID=UPI003F5C73C4